MISIKKIGLIYILIVSVIILAGCHAPYILYETGEADVTPGLPLRGFVREPQIRPPTAEEAVRFPQITNLPTLYIELEYIPFNRINREEYVPGSYTFIFGGETGIFNEPLKIKGRGNWTWTNPKRSYTLVLAREASWNGLPSAGKWRMIANWADKSLLRNYTALNLARILHDDWSPSSFFADVFVNGEFQGNYLITEAIEIHENRLNLNRMTDGIFELEEPGRHPDHSECIRVADSNSCIVLRRPQGSVFPEVRAANLAVFSDFFREMQDSLNHGYESYSQFIDVPSFVNWVILHEFAKDLDSGYFRASVWMFIQNGRLHMGPAWDFDTAFGNHPEGHATSPIGYKMTYSPWFRRLMRDDTFLRLVQERWTELRQDGVFDDFLRNIYVKSIYIEESARRNFEVWPCALEFTFLRGRQLSRFTFADEVDYLYDWVKTRIEWLDAQWYIG